MESVDWLKLPIFGGPDDPERAADPSPMEPPALVEPHGEWSFKYRHTGLDGAARPLKTPKPGMLLEFLALTSDAVMGIETERLPWNRSGIRGRPGRADLLRKFVRLIEAGTAQDVRPEVFRFARRWGVFEACQEHAPLPWTHVMSCERVSIGDWWYAEPIRPWLDLSLHMNIVRRQADWLRDHPPMPLPPHPEHLAEEHAAMRERYVVADCVVSACHEWMRDGAVMPRMIWGADGPQMVLAGSGLFASLGLEMVRTVTLVDRWFICSACGDTFTPHPAQGKKARRPRWDQRRYCRSCQAQGKPKEYAEYRRRNGLSTPRRRNPDNNPDNNPGGRGRYTTDETA